MKHLILFLSLIFTFSSGDLFAQTSIKVYANSYYLNTNLSPNRATFNRQNLDFAWPVIGFSKVKPSGKINEWQMGAWKYKAQTDTTQFESGQVSVRFQRDRKLWISANKKFNAQLGMAYNVSGTFSRITPTTTSFYPRKSSGLILDVKLFTGLEYFISDRFFLDLSTSFLGATLGTTSTSTENPSLTLRQQRSGGFDFDLLTNRVLRIGFGYVLKRDEEKQTKI